MTTQLTQARTPDPATSLRKLINGDYIKQQMALALPKYLTPDMMSRCALTALLKNPTLLKADQASFTLALMNLAQWGLPPDGRRAHLVPFWNSKANRFDVVAIPDYKGLAELVLDGGNATGIHADVVCENDDFSYNLGEIVRHIVDFRRPRGEPYAAYAMISLKEGRPKVEVMSRDEIESIRDNSQGWRAFKSGKVNSSVWADFPGEMWKKTVFKRATKWLKLGDRAQMAVEADDAIDASKAMPDVVSIAQVQPVEIQGEPVTIEEHAEAQAGLAPEPQPQPQPKAKAKEAAPTGQLSPQDELRILVETAGFTIDDLLALAEKEGFFKDPSAIATWDECPLADTKRIMRNRLGILQGLEQLKGGQS